MSNDGTDRSSTHAFGRWRFDAVTGDLDDRGATTRLEPQVARLLAYFLEHQGRLITRDDLIRDVWGARVVSDHAISRCVSILRGRLTPKDRNAFVETVVRRGFIAHFPPPEVETGHGVSAGPGGEDIQSHTASGAFVDDRRLSRTDRRLKPEKGWPRMVVSWRPWALASIFIATAFFAIDRAREPGQRDAGPDERETPMLAILPFVSHDDSAESAFFASGIHDDLLTRLARFQSMRVISRTSVEEYRDRTANVREIGRALGADAILEGGVQRLGDRVRINVQLIDARDDLHLWAEQYEAELSVTNLFEIQAEMTRSISNALHAALTRRDAGELEVIPTRDMAAYRAYHEAMQLRNFETIESRAYVAALERAVSLDPGFVRAWAELAGSLSLMNMQRRDAATLERLETILERIGSIAPGSADELIAQSYYTYYVLKDHHRALELIQRAQELRPNDLNVLELKTWIHRRLGGFTDMVVTLRQAQRLDPRNDYWNWRLANTLIMLHRYGDAAAEIDGAAIRTFRLAKRAALLALREHRDPDRYLQEMLALQREYGQRLTSSERWQAQILAREFVGATASVEQPGGAVVNGPEWGDGTVPDRPLAEVITAFFRHGPLKGSAPAAVARQRLLQEGAAGFDGYYANHHLALALVSAAMGEADEAERSVRAWFREAPTDQAELANRRHYACRALGMAGAAAAAVRCLGKGLIEPSLIIPFIETDLPYYDSVRGADVFVAFVQRR